MMRESLDVRMTRMEGLLAMLVRHAEIGLDAHEHDKEVRRAYRRGYFAGRHSLNNGKPPTPALTFGRGLVKIESRRRNKQ